MFLRLLFLFVTLALFSEESDHRDPSLVAYGVHLFSGQYADVIEDMRTISSVPLRVERSFAEANFKGDFGGGWNWNWKSSISFTTEKAKHRHKHVKTTYYGPHHATLRFDIRKRDRQKVEELLFAVDRKGETNGRSWYLSGQSNLHNLSIFFDENKKRAILRNGSGDEKIFLYDTGHGGKRAYNIHSEKLASLQTLQYLHDKQDRMERIGIVGREGKELFAMAARYPKDLKKEPHIDVYDCVGRSVRYLFHRHKIPYGNDQKKEEYTLSEVLRPTLPNLHYNYVIYDEALQGLISRISQPDGRFCDFQYYTKGKEEMPETGKKVSINSKDFRFRRIKKVMAPLGAASTPITMATFRYDEIGKSDFHEKGITQVWDAQGKKKSYEHEDFRLKAIQFWGPHNNFVEAYEKFLWSKEEDREGDLKIRYVEDGSGKVLLVREYFYDENHNVVEEKIWGNITGDNHASIVVASEGIVHSKGPCQHSFFRYSSDNRNLLLYEKKGDLEINYSYHSNSSLLARKEERDSFGTKRITTYDYDAASCVSRESIEDETGFKEEKRIVNNQLGLPEEIAYFGFVEGSSKSIKKELYRYSKKGLLLEKKIIGSDGITTASFSYDYDGKGNCILERNPVGQEIRRSFDANNNLLVENGPDPRVRKEYSYDFMNRLIEMRECHPDGMRSTHYRYTILSQKSHEIDFRGHEKEFHYDWHNMQTATLYPTVITEEGATRHLAREEHNFLGHTTKKIGLNGAISTIVSNILGAPCLVSLPGGGKETTGYTLFGQKSYFVEAGGLRHEYRYDGFGRLVAEKLFDETGVLLSEITKRYSGLHLLEETDSYGIKTTYAYDYGGRLLQKERGELFEIYQYDPLGRLQETKTPLEIKRIAYNLLGQVLEEKSFSANEILESWTEYGYDEAGNRSCIVHHLDNETCLRTEILYDTYGRILHKKEGLQETHIQYFDQFTNAFGQKVQKKIITASDGLTTEIEYDPLGRERLIEKKGPFGETIQKKAQFFDGLGHLVKTKEILFYQGKEEKTIVNTFAYDSDGNLIETIEAAATSERKKTAHEYSCRRKTKTIKPDGVAIFYRYDAMGKMRRLTSSDETIDYEYRYDGLIRLVEVIDHIAQTTLKRGYDREEHLLQEEFPAYTIAYNYDSYNRLSDVSLLGGSWGYRYEGSRLAKIERTSQENFQENSQENSYEIAFTKYDLAGELKEMQLLGKGGAVSFQHDNEGTNCGFTHPLLADAILSFDQAKRPTRHLRTTLGEEIHSSIQYDPLGQVIEEGGRSYQFDSLYNLRKEGDLEYTYNDLNQRDDLRYDLNGNLLEAKGTRFHYDALDRLIAVEVEGKTIQYTYDGLHRRLSANDRNFIYQGECEIGSLLNNEVQELRIIHSAAFGEVGSTIAIEVQNRPYSVLTDPFGHIAGLIDKEGLLQESVAFSPFGKELSKEGLHPWRFSSKRLDSDTGLVFFGERFYSIDLMRWLTPDPLSFEDGSNLYAYVQNNPIIQLDAFGLFIEKGGWLDRTLHFLFTIPGRSLEFLGRQCIPIPLVREAVEFTGWILQGNKYQEWTPSFSRDHSITGCFLNGKEISLHEAPGDRGIYDLNGMNNSKEEMLARVKETSERNPNHAVFYTYNGSKGFATDLVECVFHQLGISTSPVDKTVQHINDIYAAKGKEFQLLLQSHSQGGLITSQVGDRLDPDIMKKITVRTYGSARIIDDERWGSAVNYINRRDPIPMLDLFRLYRHGTTKSPKLVVLESISGTFFDHSFTGKTYSKAATEEIEKFLYRKK